MGWLLFPHRYHPSRLCVRPSIQALVHFWRERSKVANVDVVSFGPLGMMTSMAEECADAPVDLPKAMSLCVPVGGVIGLLFVSTLALRQDCNSQCINGSY